MNAPVSLSLKAKAADLAMDTAETLLEFADGGNTKL